MLHIIKSISYYQYNNLISQPCIIISFVTKLELFIYQCSPVAMATCIKRKRQQLYCVRVALSLTEPCNYPSTLLQFSHFLWDAKLHLPFENWGAIKSNTKTCITILHHQALKAVSKLMNFKVQFANIWGNSMSACPLSGSVQLAGL